VEKRNSLIKYLTSTYWDGLSLIFTVTYSTIVILNGEWHATVGLRSAYRGQNRAICERDNSLNLRRLTRADELERVFHSGWREDAAQCARVPTYLPVNGDSALLRRFLVHAIQRGRSAGKRCRVVLYFQCADSLR